MTAHDREYERLQEQRSAEPAAPQAEVSPPERLASTIGNQAFGALARQGAGILPDGRAHPDVEATIAQTRGSGSSLDAGTADRIGPKLGSDLGDVRVHTDDTADALTSSVSAKAFTTGNDVYFAKGEYNPGSGEGQHLLAHELSHVVQQRGAPTSGPLTVSQPGEPLEVEADQAANASTA
jgi:uncharacterized protein DUF4157